MLLVLIKKQHWSDELYSRPLVTSSVFVDNEVLYAVETSVYGLVTGLVSVFTPVYLLHDLVVYGLGMSDLIVVGTQVVTGLYVVTVV